MAANFGGCAGFDFDSLDGAEDAFVTSGILRTAGLIVRRGGSLGRRVPPDLEVSSEGVRPLMSFEFGVGFRLKHCLGLVS